MIHIPVLLEPILHFLAPVLRASEKPRYFDGTFGRGGHLRALLETDSRLSALAFDRDPDAVTYAKMHFQSELASGRLQIQQKNFADFDPESDGLFDVMLVDLGVSSPQLDESQRGFSFYHEGPLDMRMDPTQGPTAADLLTNYGADELADLFRQFGEVPKPYRVAKAIEDRQKANPLKTTKELAALIEKVDGWQRKGFHPATQYFMALRLAVNEELESVERALQPLLHGLKPSGRLAVLTFHSLEDRIVKNVFKDATDLGSALFKNVLQATPEEQKANPRSRSAKLRIFERRDENQVEEPTKPGMKKRRPKRQDVSPNVFRKDPNKNSSES